MSHKCPQRNYRDINFRDQLLRQSHLGSTGRGLTGAGSVSNVVVSRRITRRQPAVALGRGRLSQNRFGSRFGAAGQG